MPGAPSPKRAIALIGALVGLTACGDKEAPPTPAAPSGVVSPAPGPQTPSTPTPTDTTPHPTEAPAVVSSLADALGDGALLSIALRPDAWGKLVEVVESIPGALAAELPATLLKADNPLAALVVALGAEPVPLPPSLLSSWDQRSPMLIATMEITDEAWQVDGRALALGKMTKGQLSIPLRTRILLPSTVPAALARELTAWLLASGLAPSAARVQEHGVVALFEPRAATKEAPDEPGAGAPGKPTEADPCGRLLGQAIEMCKELGDNQGECEAAIRKSTKEHAPSTEDCARMLAELEAARGGLDADSESEGPPLPGVIAVAVDERAVRIDWVIDNLEDGAPNPAHFAPAAPSTLPRSRPWTTFAAAGDPIGVHVRTWRLPRLAAAVGLVGGQNSLATVSPDQRLAAAGQNASLAMRAWVALSHANAELDEAFMGCSGEGSCHGLVGLTPAGSTVLRAGVASAAQHPVPLGSPPVWAWLDLDLKAAVDASAEPVGLQGRSMDQLAQLFSAGGVWTWVNILAQSPFGHIRVMDRVFPLRAKPAVEAVNPSESVCDAARRRGKAHCESLSGEDQTVCIREFLPQLQHPKVTEDECEKALKSITLLGALNRPTEDRYSMRALLPAAMAWVGSDPLTARTAGVYPADGPVDALAILMSRPAGSSHVFEAGHHRVEVGGGPDVGRDTVFKPMLAAQEPGVIGGYEIDGVSGVLRFDGDAVSIGPADWRAPPGPGGTGSAVAFHTAGQLCLDRVTRALLDAWATGGPLGHEPPPPTLRSSLSADLACAKEQPDTRLAAAAIEALVDADSIPSLAATASTMEEPLRELSNPPNLEKLNAPKEKPNAP